MDQHKNSIKVFMITMNVVKMRNYERKFSKSSFSTISPFSLTTYNYAMHAELPDGITTIGDWSFALLKSLVMAPFLTVKD